MISNNSGQRPFLDFQLLFQQNDLQYDGVPKSERGLPSLKRAIAGEEGG